MPSSLPAIMAVSGMIGGGISAYGQMKQGDAAVEASNRNAQISEQEASLIRQNSALDEIRQRKYLASTTGSQVAGYSARGVTMTGSPLDVIADSISNADLEIQIGKYNAESQARGAENQAAMTRWNGQQAQSTARAKALSTLLTSGIDSGFKLSNEKIGYSKKGNTKIGESNGIYTAR